MYMLPRDNHCITPTPSCGTSSVVPAANPDWLNPVHDGPSFASSPLVSADSSSSSMAPMTTPAMEITATPNTSLEGFAQPGSVPGDVGLLYRRLGRHLSLPIQNFVPKRECPANDDSDSNDSELEPPAKRVTRHSQGVVKSPDARSLRRLTRSRE